MLVVNGKKIDRLTGRHVPAVIAAGLVPFLAACGPSTLEIYDRFEADLVEELRSEWNATPTGGCPEAEVRSSRVESGTSGWEDVNGKVVRSAAGADRDAAWLRSIPGHQCRCIQQTVMQVRHRSSVIDPGRFAGADLAALEAWRAELDRSDPFRSRVDVRLYDPEKHDSPDLARKAVELWNVNRFERGGAGGTEGGWQDAAATSLSSRGIRRFDPFMGCGRLRSYMEIAGQLDPLVHLSRPR